MEMVPTLLESPSCTYRGNKVASINGAKRLYYHFTMNDTES
jgi:hypothetical protein